MHMTLFDGSTYNFGSYVLPGGRLGSFGVAFMRLGTDDIIQRNNFVSEGTFDYSYSQFLLAAGKQVHDRISFGLNLKIVNQSLASDSDYGFGLDYSMAVEITRHLKAGVIARDLVPAELRLRKTKESVPTSLSGGFALKDMRLTDRTDLSISGELEKTENRSIKVHAGMQTLFDDTYALRIGYDRDNLSFGAGAIYGRLVIDYAYKALDYVTDSHRFSLGFLLGVPVGERREKADKEELEAGTRLLTDERMRQFSFFKEKADDFAQRFRLDSALTYYHRALAFDEKNYEIIGIIAGIEESFRVKENQRDRIAEAELENRTSIDNYLKQAGSFNKKKYYPAALDMIRLILELDPNHVKALELKQVFEDAADAEITANIARIKEAEARFEYSEVIDACTRILYLDPRNTDAIAAKKRVGIRMNLVHQLNLGIARYVAGDYAEAERRFRSVLQIDRKDLVALEYIQKLGSKVDRSYTLEDLQQAPGVWKLYLDGLRFMRDNEYAKAIEAWEKVLKIYPTSLETLENLRQARLRLESETSKE